MQPLVADHTTIPHMKAMDVPFNLMYDSLICFKGLQSDRPKCWASLVDPGEYQNMIIKYLSVGLQSWFSYQQVALNLLFQMRYDSLPNSNKQPSDRQRAFGTPIFTSKQDCFAYCFAQWAFLGSANIPHILVYHSVPPWSTSSYHTPYERGHQYLSYNPNCLYIMLQVSLLWLQS